MSLTKLPLARNYLARESLVSDIPPGDGKIANLFYSVVEIGSNSLPPASRERETEKKEAIIAVLADRKWGIEPIFQRQQNERCPL